MLGRLRIAGWCVLLVLGATCSSNGSKVADADQTAGVQQAPDEIELEPGRKVVRRTVDPDVVVEAARSDGTFVVRSVDESCEVGLFTLDDSPRLDTIEPCFTTGWVDAETVVSWSNLEDSSLQRYRVADPSGGTRFTFRANGAQLLSSVVVAIYDNRIVTRDETTGKVLWKKHVVPFEIVEWTRHPAARAGGDAATRVVTLIVFPEDDPPSLRHLDRTSGETLRETELVGFDSPAGSALADGAFAAIGKDDVLRVYELFGSTGPRWKAPVFSVSNERHVRIGNDRVFVLDGRDVAAFDRDTGERVWQHRYRQSWRLVLHGDTVIAVADPFVGELDPDTGEVVWRYALGAEARTVLPLGEDEWIVGSEHGTEVLTVDRTQRVEPVVLEGHVRFEGLEEPAVADVWVTGASSNESDKEGDFELAVPFDGRLRLRVDLADNRRTRELESTYPNARHVVFAPWIETIDTETDTDPIDILMRPRPVYAPDF